MSEERNGTPGRPRAAASVRQGDNAREEILDAAAELFTTQGYGSVSTRKIAEQAGFRQASLYYYFRSKEDILVALLDQTVDFSVSLAQYLASYDAPTTTRLYALAQGDTAFLCASRWNLGALYLLPELRGARLAEFQQRRTQLRRFYEQLSREVATHTGCALSATVLPFRLVESVIILRADEEAGVLASEETRELPEVIAEGVLRMVGFTGHIEQEREEARTLLSVFSALPQ